MTMSPARLRPTTTSLLAAGLGTLVLAGPGAGGALAQGCQGQPGMSAVEQYCEAIPRGDGGRDRPGGSGSGAPGNTLNDRTNRGLQRAGADGEAIRRLADDDSEAPADSGDDDAGGGQGSRGDSGGDAGDGAVLGTTVSGGPQDATGSPLRAATQAASSGSTAGPALAWGLVGMSVLGAIGAVVVRRRGGPLAEPGSGDEPPQQD